MPPGGDNTSFVPTQVSIILILLIFMEQNYSFLCILLLVFATNLSKMGVVDMNQFWFCYNCTCRSLEYVLRSFCFCSKI